MEKESYKEKLADNTWQQIQNGLRDGNPMNWQVGDTKDLTLTNGDTYTIRLVDLQEGRYETPDGVKCKATFEFVQLLKGITRAMNSSEKTYGGVTNYTAGGWLNSDMRSYIQTSILPLIPEELSNYMLLNKVGSASYGGSGQTDATNGGVVIYSDGDKLFLGTASEYFGSGSVSRQRFLGDYTTIVNLYPQFDYYAIHDADTTRIKQQLGATFGIYYEWWNRSPSYEYSFAFCLVRGRGFADGGDANAHSTVSVGLCFTL